MTSTGFNVGVGDIKRPTSKVLKPPGGGHTNIFGAGDENPIPNKRDHNASSLTFSNYNNASPVKKTVSSAPPPNENPSAPSSNSSENGSAAPSRQRVPPGGFSSGLW